MAAYKIDTDRSHYTSETRYAIKLPNGQWFEDLSYNGAFRDLFSHSKTYFKSIIDARDVIEALVRRTRKLGVADYQPEIFKYEHKEVWTEPVLEEKEPF